MDNPLVAGFVAMALMLALFRYFSASENQRSDLIRDARYYRDRNSELEKLLEVCREERLKLTTQLATAPASPAILAELKQLREERDFYRDQHRHALAFGSQVPGPLPPPAPRYLPQPAVVDRLRQAMLLILPERLTATDAVLLAAYLQVELEDPATPSEHIAQIIKEAFATGKQDEFRKWLDTKRADVISELFAAMIDQ